MLIFSTILVNSCKKSETTTNSTNPTITGKDKAQWTFDGTSSSADSSFALLAYNRIMAYKDIGVNAKSLTINLSSLAVGTYTLSSVSPNVLTYVVAQTVDHTSQSGTVNITANTGAKLSGTYNALMDNGLTFSGTFSEIPIR